jgi:hypothetical protein
MLEASRDNTLDRTNGWLERPVDLCIVTCIPVERPPSRAVVEMMFIENDRHKGG